MKTKLALIFLLVATCLFAQQVPQVLTQSVGINPPDPGTCGGPQDVHQTYMQTGDPANAFAGEWICVQSTSRGFAWAAVAMLPPGTTGTRGTVLVYPSFCGSTVGNATCANMSDGTRVRTIGGIATLSSSSAVISGISPPFTATYTFGCVGQDTTTITNPVKIVNTSTSSITITNTTGSSDSVSWICQGY